MGQDDVLKVLMKASKPMTSKEINQKINKTTSSQSLKQLLRYKEIKMTYKLRGLHNVPHYFL